MGNQQHFLFSVKLFAICIFLTACSGKEFTAVFETPRGPLEIDLELARTPEERQRGLMFRDRIGDLQGMLFCFEQDRKHAFWMKNTYLSLDIVFLSAEGEVVDVLERLPPCPMEPCPSYASGSAARYALEVKAGFVKQHGIRTGDHVRLKIHEARPRGGGRLSQTFHRERTLTVRGGVIFHGKAWTEPCA